ncbi:aspartyl-phosphate phosphatase Spo0E family protein [Paenibacillus sp. M1]|uniref:Aspartyl-phosphate phosphatase Spo0E family protein n=1 Tax=Paenibacillus haidiansis TaxID=1574488 RepID=A0ABU7VXW2_9BACL
MMSSLSVLEEERKKLNEIGCKSLENGVPLFQNEALQAQSRRVDLLNVQQHKRVGLKQRLS